MNIKQVLLFIILIFIVYIVLYHPKKRLINIESFQDKKINKKDANLFILDDDNNDKAIIQNIDSYTVHKDKDFNALKYNGKDSRMIIPNLELSNFSLSLYFKVKKNKKQTLVCSKSGNWSVDINNKSLKYVFDGSVILSDKVLEENKWYNLVVNVSSGGGKIHINGIENREAISYDKITKEIILGCNKDSENNFDGYIGKIKMYNRLLEADEICHISNMCPVIVPEESDKCEFIPRGLNESDCVSNCKALNKCDLSYCQELCKNCIDYDQCKWIKRPLPKEEDKKDTSIHTRPYPPVIRVLPRNKELLLEWAKPYDGGSPITNYLVMVYDKFNPESGVKLSVTAEPECEECNHIITGLKNGKFYDVSIRAINNQGLGEISNIVSESPNGPVEPHQNNNVLLESDTEISKLLQTELGYNPNECVKDFKEYNPLDYYEPLDQFMNKVKLQNIKNNL